MDGTTCGSRCGSRGCPRSRHRRRVRAASQGEGPGSSGWLGWKQTQSKDTGKTSAVLEFGIKHKVLV